MTKFHQARARHANLRTTSPFAGAVAGLGMSISSHHPATLHKRQLYLDRLLGGGCVWIDPCLHRSPFGTKFTREDGQYDRAYRPNAPLGKYNATL